MELLSTKYVIAFSPVRIGTLFLSFLIASIDIAWICNGITIHTNNNIENNFFIILIPLFQYLLHT